MSLINKLFGKKKISNEVKSSEELLLEALINGESVTKDMALSIPAVSSSVSLICETVSSIPIKLYCEKDNKVEEIKNDKRVSLLNNDTKDTLDGCQFKRAMVEDYLLSKGAYAYIEKKGNKVNKLIYIPSEKVSIYTNNNPMNKNYTIVVNGSSTQYNDFDFIKLLRNTKDGSSGTSLIDQVSKAIETAYQSILYQFVVFKTGGNKKGFLQSENNLSTETMENLKQAWNKLYDNNEKSKIVILNKGLKFQESSNSNSDIQLNEIKQTLNQEIRDIFHIKSNYNDTFKEAIQPILVAIETALNRELLLEREKETYFFSFDLKEILKGTPKERYEAYKVALSSGWITPNEVRYLEDYDSIEGLDIIPMSLGNVIYDVKTQKYYTPNMDSTTSLNKGGEKNE